MERETGEAIDRWVAAAAEGLPWPMPIEDLKDMAETAAASYGPGTFPTISDVFSAMDRWAGVMRHARGRESLAAMGVEPALVGEERAVYWRTLLDPNRQTSTREDSRHASTIR